MTEQPGGFDALGQAIADHLQVPFSRGRRFAALIGDLPEVRKGEVLIRDEDGVLLARIPESLLYEEGKPAGEE